jgi:hypothetical protein
MMGNTAGKGWIVSADVAVIARGKTLSELEAVVPSRDVSASGVYCVMSLLP